MTEAGYTILNTESHGEDRDRYEDGLTTVGLILAATQGLPAGLVAMACLNIAGKTEADLAKTPQELQRNLKGTKRALEDIALHHFTKGAPPQ